MLPTAASALLTLLNMVIKVGPAIAINTTRSLKRGTERYRGMVLRLRKLWTINTHPTTCKEQKDHHSYATDTPDLNLQEGI
jgi:hypothetical protein